MQIIATNLRFSHPELPMGDAKPSRTKGGTAEETKGGGKMNITMGDLILAVIQSIAIAGTAGLVFYTLLTWVA